MHLKKCRVRVGAGEKERKGERAGEEGTGQGRWGGKGTRQRVARREGEDAAGELPAHPCAEQLAQPS